MPRLPDPVPQEKGSGVRLAVNLYDIDRVDPLIRGMLLSGKLCLDRGRIVNGDPTRLDEAAVEFTCDLLTAACCCDVMRSHDRNAGDYPTRVYLKRRSWTKVPGNAALTLVEDGKPVLNPAVFGGEPEPLAEPVLAQRRRVEV